MRPVFLAQDKTLLRLGVALCFVSCLTNPLPAFAIEPKGLPSKSEWLPGKIKRGTDGKLFLENAQSQTPPVPKKVKKPKKIINAKTFYKNWVELSWKPPTHYVDGRAMKEVSGYHVYYWTEREPVRKTVDVKNAHRLRLDNLKYGEIYFFAVTAYDKHHIESEYSEVIPIRLEKPAE